MRRESAQEQYGSEREDYRVAQPEDTQVPTVTCVHIEMQRLVTKPMSNISSIRMVSPNPKASAHPKRVHIAAPDTA